MPEFLPVYQTESGSSYLVNLDGLPDISAVNLPFGRLANPLLEVGSVVTGKRQDQVDVGLGFWDETQYPHIYSPDERLIKETSMYNKVYDPYTQNIYSSPYSIPANFETQYYGIDTPDAMRRLDQRLNGIDQNLCVLYGGHDSNSNDENDPANTHIALEVAQPNFYAPYWLNGRPTRFVNGQGDTYVTVVSGNPENIWPDGKLPRLVRNIDDDLVNRENGSIHTYLVGYDETIKQVTECLTNIAIPGGMLSGFSSDSNPGGLLDPDRILAITALSPVELMITDPSGRRLGYDPATGNDVSEIPDAMYYRDTSTTHKYLIITSPEVGDYTLTVTGTGSGDYTLVGTFVQGNQVTSPLFASGTTHPGESFTKTIFIPQTAAEVPTPPNAYAGLDVTVVAGQPITFAGSFSDLNPNDTHTSAWDFGDGNIANDTLTPTHLYTLLGTYPVTLTITDSTGFVVADTLMTATVAPPCTLGEFSTLLDVMRTRGQIANRGVYESLREKLIESQKELDRGKADKAAEKLWDFVEQADQKAGKHMAAEVVATLKESAFCILGTLGKDATSLREIEGLRDLVASDYKQGLITSVSLRDKLDERLSKAQEKLVDDGAKKAVEELNKFIAEVTKERGKKINTAAADELIARAQSIVARLHAEAEGGDDDD